MSDLDNKLRELDFFFNMRPSNILRAIKEIKQVFKDAGYRLFPLDIDYARSSHETKTVKSISYRGKAVPFTNMDDYTIFSTEGHKITDFDIEYGTANLNPLMTGQEWYDRFKRLSNESVNVIIPSLNYKEFAEALARKAGGLE